jgi:hypothetical protein
VSIGHLKVAQTHFRARTVSVQAEGEIRLTTFSERLKLAEDVERIDRILEGERPSYKTKKVSLSLEDLKWQSFSTGNATSLAVMSMLAYQQPESFDMGSVIRLDNSWLKRANSKNYHHFFPKSFLKKTSIDPDLINSVLNITLVSADLNKRKIGGKAPSVYMQMFRDSNPDLRETMETHLIYDLDEFGVWDDDYERFLEKRGERVLEELKERLGEECFESEETEE